MNCWNIRNKLEQQVKDDFAMPTHPQMCALLNHSRFRSMTSRMLGVERTDLDDIIGLYL